MHTIVLAMWFPMLAALGHARSTGRRPRKRWSPVAMSARGLGLLLMLGSVAWAGPTVVQSNSSWTQGTATPSVAFSNPNAAGNLLWVAIGSSDSIAAPTDTQGNTYTLAVNVTGTGGAGNAAIYYVASAKAGGNTVSCNHPGSGNTHCQIAEISGLVATLPLDQIGSQTGTSDCYVWTSGATSQPNEWVAAFFFDSSKNETLSTGESSAGTTYTQLQQSNDASGGAAGLSESANSNGVGMQTAGCSGNGTDPLSEVMATFRLASGNGPTVVQSDSGYAQGTANPSIAFTRPNTAGNLLWVAVGSTDTIAAPTDTQGNTYTLAASVSGASGAGNAAIYYAASANGGGANTVTCHHPGSGDTHCHIAEISGLAAVSPLDQTGSTAAFPCTVSTAGATAQPNEWIGAFVYDGALNELLIPGGGYTALQSTNDASGGDAAVSMSEIGSSGVQAAGCGGNGGSVKLSQLITTFKTANGGAPLITSITPSKGGPDQYTYLSINGMNFGAAQGTSTLTIGGVAGPIQNWGANLIVAPVPNGLVAGNAAVVVTVNGLSSNAGSFLVTPYVTGIAPSPALPGTAVTISGAGFGNSAASGTVSFNGTLATSTSWSDNSIVVPVPSGATTGNVVVTVNGVASLFPISFTVGPPPPPPPAISSLSASSGSVGDSITITGTNFGSSQGSSTVAFTGVAATVSFWSDTSITATVPADARSGTVAVTVAGQSSNDVSFTVNVNITSLNPPSGTLGSSVTIAGSGFGPGASRASHVTFNGVSASTTSWSSTSIRATVPASATSGDVVVTVFGVASNPATYTVVPALLITSLYPNAAAVGATVTIAGTNFGATQGSSSVTFNGVPAAVSSWSDTSISAVAPAGATTGDVVVTVGGVNTPGVAFTVTPSPVITSVTPNSAAVNSLITIAGSNFGSNQSNGAVTFNGTPAIITNWSETSISAVPTSGTTSGNVVVSIFGAPSNGVNFTVVPPPAITSITPSSATAGTAVTVNGTNFGASQGIGGVALNGTPVTVSSWSDTSIGFTVPSSAPPGIRTLVVTASAGIAGPTANFTVLPTVTSLSPTLGVTGTSVTIAGTSFGNAQNNTTVTFNGVAATPTSWGSTQIIVPVPSAATTGNVVVTSPFGSIASNGMLFTVIPAISSLSPTTGPVGTSVTINGTGFGASQGTSTVTFNGAAATPTSWSNTQIVVPLPSAATTGNVVVTVGGNPSNGVPFTLIPTIASLSPTSGAVGTAVTITGTNFGSSQGNGGVTFNGMAATVNSWSNTSIGVTVPASATTGNVVVTAAGGVASSGVPFTVVPTIINLTPSSGPVLATVTITGTGFGSTQGTSTVTFNGTAAIPTSWSNTGIVVSVPSAATTGNVVVTVGGNASNGVPFTVQIAHVALSSSLNPSTYGSTVTLTATMTSNAASPTGTVTFLDGTTSIGSATIIGHTATLSTALLPAGSHSITASYGGDGNYGGAQSSALTQTINVAQASLALTSSFTGTPGYGTPITFTATVTPAVITGGVTFSDGTTNLGSAPINNGQALLTISTLDVGSHSITASLAGTSNFVGSASTAVSVPVAPSATSTAFDCVASPCGTSIYGNAVTFTVAVSITGTPNPKEKTPSGTVEITVLKSATATCPGASNVFDLPIVLTNGRGSAQTTALTTDVVAICAVYQGDAFYQASLSPPLAWTVTPAASNTALATNAPNPAPTGTSITFTATVTGIAGGATPTGKVTFTDNTTNQQIGNTNVGNNGQATFVTSTLQAGQHSITATYNGDANYQSSTSNAVALTLQDFPNITALSLNHAPAGIGLQITGIHFGASGVGSKVEFIDDATKTPHQLTLVAIPGAWSDQSIKVVAPGLPVGKGNIVVTTPAGTSNKQPFEIVSPFGCP